MQLPLKRGSHRRRRHARHLEEKVDVEAEMGEDVEAENRLCCNMVG